MNDSHFAGESKIGPYQIAILILTIVVLIAFVADTVLPMPKEVVDLLQVIDTFVCVLLLADFFIRLYRAESKLAFMKWGWIDLVASIPNLEVLRWGRLVRVLRIIRLLRGLRSLHKVLTMTFRNKMESGVISLSLAAFLLVVFASVSVLVCERSPDANIKTAADAVWWSITTITTVGYGDRYPVTMEGRLIGVILMIGGVSMFAGLSGMVASLFMGGNKEKKPSDTAEILARLEQLQAKLDALEAQKGGGA